MPSSRLPEIDYAVRGAAFGYCFLVVGLLLWERGAGPVAWTLLALQFLAYPHLVYLRARSARDPHRAELQNLLVDSALLGAWTAALGFPTWIAYAFAFATTLNGAVNRGAQGAFRSVASFCAGALVSFAFGEFPYWSSTGPLVTALAFFGSIGYAAAVGTVAWRENRRLRELARSGRAGEERYRLIAQNAGEFVAMVDRDGRWLYASPSYGRLLPREDLERGADAFRRLHEEDAYQVRAAVQVVIESGDSCRLRMRVHAADGELRTLETLVRPARDETGAIRGAVLASRALAAHRAPARSLAHWLPKLRRRA